MAVGIETLEMPKKTESAKRNDVPVKMDAGVLADCRIAAAYKGVSLAEFISEAMRPIAKQTIDEEHARRATADRAAKKTAK